jgi:hypothetical protein
VISELVKVGLGCLPVVAGRDAYSSWPLGEQIERGLCVQIHFEMSSGIQQMDSAKLGRLFVENLVALLGENTSR